MTDLGNLGGTEWNTPMAIDLNALVAHGYTDTLTSAQDINDFGVITGRTLDPVTGARPAFTATPVP